MPAKKATAVSKPTYAVMVQESIKTIGDRTGSSVQAITKQLQAQYGFEINKPALIKAIKKGVEAGDLVQIKASYKLGKKPSSTSKPKKPATTTTTTAATTTKKKAPVKPKKTSTRSQKAAVTKPKKVITKKPRSTTTSKKAAISSKRTATGTTKRTAATKKKSAKK